MASLIKKQLARRLAQYFDGMTSDDFSLSFFRGKGGVKDLSTIEPQMTLHQPD
jgi:hypothetical protein